MSMRIPFVGQSYTARSIDADNQRTLNCYLEMDNNSPRAAVALYGTPGLEFIGTISNGPIRAMLREKSVIYVVSANEVYKTTKSGGVYTSSFLGNVGTSTGPIGIASNGAQILIVDGTAGWIITTATFAYAAITDPAFPTGVTRATYQDSYFIVTGDGTGKFYINHNPGNGLVWNGTDFASAEGAPDNTIGCISDHRELWLFGDTSIEVWEDTGNVTFPFERSPNAFIEHGCAAADTIAKLDNTIFLLGTDDRGGAVVWRMQGYTPVRVSTHAVEKAMQGYSIISDARAFTYQQEGHAFYVLSFPTADATWVYDASTDQWHERCWTDTFGVDHMWRGACHVFFNGDHLVGDASNGNFFRLNLAFNTDNGANIKRLRRTQTMENMQHRVFYSQLQIDMETGTSTNMSLRYSNDGGHTWSGTKTQSTGSTNDSRVIFRNLGSGRNRVWELSAQTGGKWAILGGVADVIEGTS